MGKANGTGERGGEPRPSASALAAARSCSFSTSQISASPAANAPASPRLPHECTATVRLGGLSSCTDAARWVESAGLLSGSGDALEIMGDPTPDRPRGGRRVGEMLGDVCTGRGYGNGFSTVATMTEGFVVSARACSDRGGGILPKLSGDADALGSVLRPRPAAYPARDRLVLAASIPRAVRSGLEVAVWRIRGVETDPPIRRDGSGDDDSGAFCGVF